MYRTFITHLLAAFCLSAGLAGCIKEDFSDCPPAPQPDPDKGTLRLQFAYLLHNHVHWEERTIDGQTDCFHREVSKVNMYVYDEAGNFILRETAQTPEGKLPQGYTHGLSLPGGTYQVVVWGNRWNDETLSLYGKEMPLEESRVHLASLDEGATPLLQDSLFHGMTSERITVVPGEEQTVPVHLMKDRYDIRLLVHWRGKDKQECHHPSHLKGLEARLTGFNASLDFFNRPLDGDSIVYLPGDFNSGRYDSAFYGGTASKRAYAYKADFATLRLMQEGEEYLTVCKHDSVVFRRRLMDIIGKLKDYQTQEALDREDHFLIELFFECSHTDDPDNPDGPDEPDKPVDPDNPDGPDNPGSVDPEEPDGPDNPDGPDEPDKPIGPDKDAWVLVSVSINGWNFIEKDIDL